MLQELDIVNEMLSTLGEAPLNELDEEHPLVPAARRIITIATYRLQSEGWWFNREHVTLHPDPTTGEVLTPADAIRADPRDRGLNFVQRGRRLYDPENATYNIGQEVPVVLIRNVPFADLPPTAQHVISLTAQVEFNKAYDGDETKVRMLTQALGQTTTLLRREHTRNVDTNLLDAPAHQRKINFIRGQSIRTRYF